MLKGKIILFGVVSLVTLGLSAAPAGADTYGFVAISHNSGTDADVVAGQLSLRVTLSEDETEALFTVANSGSMSSTVKGVYFDDGADVLGSMLPPRNDSGVSFASFGSPGNLPGGGGYGFAADFWATANHPAGLNKNGVDNIGQWVTIPFTLASGKHFDDLLDALQLGFANPTQAEDTLRVGIHVGSIGASGRSDSFIDPPTVVPLPGAFVLGALGLSAAGWRLRRSA
jgi:hypothetical protein